MSTEPDNKAIAIPKPALRGGGNVMAIVPQTFEDTMRISRAVVMAGLAPAALVGTKTGDDAASAVAIAIMSGAELGLQPMVSLRSFTVINGKPALYGDGLINVVRQSGRVAYLRTGCDTRDGKLVGWCEAKRNDTDEDKRVEFSQDDAIRAGLWTDTAKIKKFKANGESYEKANDSPWYRYPQRMLAWRAAGYCLRELFGDVLGGIRDEFEMREIEGVEEMRDITPPSRPTPPTPPPEDDEPETVTDTPETENASPDASVAEETASESVSDILTRIEDTLATAQTKAALDELWTELAPNDDLPDDEDYSLAGAIYERHAARIERKALEAAGQTTMFPGDLLPETVAAVKNGNTP